MKSIVRGSDRKHEEQIKIWVCERLKRKVDFKTHDLPSSCQGDARMSIHADITNEEYEYLHNFIDELEKIACPELFYNQ